LAYNIRKELDKSDCSFAHFTLILLLHYLVKCRRRSLAIYNNEFILDSTRVGSEIINGKATNTIGNYCISKSHTCSKCPPPARMQGSNVGTTRKQQAQQPAFHKVVQRQYWSEVAKTKVFCVKFLLDVACEKLLKSTHANMELFKK